MPKTSYILLVLMCVAQACIPQSGTGQKITWSAGPAPYYAYAYNVVLAQDPFVYTVAGNFDGTLEMYDTRAGIWTELPPMPTPRIFTAAVLNDSCIYVMGGMDSRHQYSDVVEKFDLKFFKWSSCAPLSTARCRFTAVTAAGGIIVIGGLEGENDVSHVNSDRVEIYHPGTDRWQLVTKMPTARHGHAAVAYKEEIIVVGGYSYAGALDVVEIFNITTHSWRNAMRMMSPRGFFGIAAHEGFMYVVGGRVSGPSGPVEYYDISKDLWSRLAPLPESLQRFGMTAIGDTLFVVGGEQNPHRFITGIISQQ